MNATENTDRVMADLRRVMRDSQALLHDSKDVVGEKAQAMRERMADALETAKATCRRLEEKAVEGAKATDKVIRDHPYQSIGIAFGVGMLIGYLVTRK